MSTLEGFRLLFTFLPGYIICTGLLIMYFVQNGCDYCCFCCIKKQDKITIDDEEVKEQKKDCLRTICVIFALIAVFFLFKMLMISLGIFRIIFILKKVDIHKTVSSDIEIKHVNFVYPLLIDAVLSGWPLGVISLIELFDFDNEASLNTVTLFLKTITLCVLVFVDIDRLRLWRYSINDPKRLLPVCILHTARPYPMRVHKLSTDNNVSINQGQNCVVCGEICEQYYFYCGHSHCNDNIVCIECAWSYIVKFQAHEGMDDEQFYEQLLTSRQIMKIYGERIDNYAQQNGLGNVQKHCWDSGGSNCQIWGMKVIYNVIQICLLIIGCWVFQKIWLISYFSIDGNDDRNRDNITTIYGSMFILISLVFQLILIVIHVAFLFPNSKIQRSVPRVIFNLFFVFYLFGYSLLLFDYAYLSSIHALIQIGLIGFIMQLVILPFLSVWQVYQSNAYLWQ